MNKKSTIVLQKLTAGFFLAVMLFIHVVKLVHQHDYKPGIAKETGYAKHSLLRDNCAVCDYYFVKDSHNETASIKIDPPHSITPSYTDFLSQRLTSVGLSSADRGPPSLV